MSAYVLNTCDFLAGIVEFLGINAVITPPAVSIPNVNGATSSNNTSSVAFPPVPVKMAACTAAPYATASSGLMDLFNSLPLKKSCNNCCTFGILDDPPINTTSSTPFLSIFPSVNTLSTGAIVDLNKSMFNSSNLALVIDV